MITKFNQKLSNKYRGVKGVLAVGLPFLVAGLLMASSLNLIGPSIAGEPNANTYATAPSESAIPNSFAELAGRLSPTVVNVKVTKVEKVNFNMPHMPDGQFNDFFERFFKSMPQAPENHRTQGAGSGVIISDDGYILTNNHVIEGAQEVKVTLDNKKEYRAEVVGRDPKTDLAVLKVESKQTLPAAAMGDSENLKVGDWVMAIGNPFGLNHTVTSGIVSAKGRVIGAGPYDDFIQTDASINPGNSGGPLFNMRGEVVGINTAIIPQGQGIGFAIPISTAKPLIPQLVSHGEVTRGYLGVNIQPLTPELADALGVDNSTGALVADVVSNSPADKVGIKRGDIITTWDGEDVKDSHDLPAMVAATPIDKEVQVTVLRDGKVRQMDIDVGKLPPDEIELAKVPESDQGKWGLKLHEMSPEIEQQYHLQASTGVVVVGVEPGSPADEAGIRQGDVIVEVNRTPVSSIDDVKERITKTDDEGRLLLLVQRQSGKFFVPMQQHG